MAKRSFELAAVVYSFINGGKAKQVLPGHGHSFDEAAVDAQARKGIEGQREFNRSTGAVLDDLAIERYENGAKLDAKALNNFREYIAEVAPDMLDVIGDDVDAAQQFVLQHIQQEIAAGIEPNIASSRG